MDFDRKYFAGKVAAVTGGASGIGLALCEELLESGADKVVLADYNRENLQKHEERLGKQYPGKVKGVLCDVTREAEVQQMIEQACAFGGGRLDLLINCAGAGLGGRFVDIPDDPATDDSAYKKTTTNADWEHAFALNFFGALYGCRHALPHMTEQGGGQIVNIISGVAFAPMAYQSMYAATKAALNALTQSLRAEYAVYNIKFNSATPGTTATAIFDETKAVPAGMQSPHQSAQRVLNGVANDDRLILGDDSDVDGANQFYIPNPYARITDKIFLNFARGRRKGELSFETSDVVSEALRELSPEEGVSLQTMKDVLETDMSDMDATDKRLRAYLATREADKIPEAYFAGKTAAVTGGASGVGLALCEELLRCGAKRVVLADYNRETLTAQTERLSALYPGKVKGVACNVAVEEEVKAMILGAADFFKGQFDILINCAGIGQSGMFSDVPDSAEITARTHMIVESSERWAQVFSVNFYGALYGCRAVLPVMIKQGHGQIVNIISGTAFAGMPYQSIYASTKAALGALTFVLRYEYWDEGVKFSAATAGTTATAIFAGGPVPLNAQTPKQSALRVLTGAARNEHLVFGDDDDAILGMLCGRAEVARFWDKYLAGLAASRRAGDVTDYGAGRG